ncbi:MAG: peptidylprolyl isomerase [Bacilli bacterium]|nr:peptidylprolyl isomerase [Bacilli bacterium]
MKMKKGLTCGVAFLAISLLLTGCGKEIEVKNGSKVAVSTKEEKITATEFYERIKENNISTLIDMIDTSLFEKEYEKTEEEDKYVEDQITQIKNYYGGTEETYKQMLKTYFGTEDEEELKTKLRLEYKRKQAVEDYIKENLEEKEIKEYYETKISGQIKASHILISPDVAADATDEEKQEAEEKALEKAKQLIKKIKKGEDFAKLAKKNSDDKGSASKGGDLDYFDPDTMVQEFADAVRELKVDEYTKEPIKTEYGYHIILKTGEKDKPKLEEVKDDIKEKLKDQKLNDNSALYYETLVKVREKHEISWNDSTLKSAYDKYMNQLIENAKSS